MVPRPEIRKCRPVGIQAQKNTFNDPNQRSRSAVFAASGWVSRPDEKIFVWAGFVNLFENAMIVFSIMENDTMSFSIFTEVPIENDIVSFSQRGRCKRHDVVCKLATSYLECLI